MNPFQPQTLDEISDKAKPFPIVDGPFGTQLRADEYQGAGVPLVRVTNLSFDGRFKPADLVFISKEKALEVRRSQLEKDDLLVAKTGATIGKCALFPFEDGIIASSCLKISVDRQKADPRFLLHRIVSPEGQKAILDGASGSTRTTINIGPCKQIVFRFPDRDEQTRIATVLDTVDEAIVKTEAVIVKLRQMRAGLLHDLLTRGLDEHGQLRDPIAHPEEFQDSPLGRIPRDWEVKDLKDCYAMPSRNGLYKKASSYGYGHRMVHMPQMFKGTFVDVEDAVRVAVDPEELHRFSLHEDDILFARRSLNFEGAGLCSIVGKLREPVTFESSVVRVRLQREMIVPRFAVEFLRSPVAYLLRRRFIRQVAVSGVSSGDIAQFQVPLPSPEEQSHILAKLDSHDSAVLHVEREARKLNELKTGLTTDLLTGRVRVPEGVVTTPA